MIAKELRVNKVADTPSELSKKDSIAETPSPEVLQTKADDSAKIPEAKSPIVQPLGGLAKKLHRGTYRPSHRATFIGLAVVIAILAVNAGIIAFVLKSQSNGSNAANQGQVTISQAALSKIGVSRNSIGDAGIQLIVNPNARFNGQLQVAGNVSVAGQLTLNSTFSATSANLGQLQAGNTTLNQLNVNGNGTVSNLNLRNNLVVSGTSQFQGGITTQQLLTVNNNANISGNLSVGGALSVNQFLSNSIVTDNSLTIGGHLITAGSAPGIRAGSVGSNGTVAISGNDVAGTISVNIGAGNGGSGIVAYVSFVRAYSGTPHVVVTPIVPGVDSVYVEPTSSGFNLGVNGSLTAGYGYAFDYIVEQ